MNSWDCAFEREWELGYVFVASFSVLWNRCMIRSPNTIPWNYEGMNVWKNCWIWLEIRTSRGSRLSHEDYKSKVHAPPTAKSFCKWLSASISSVAKLPDTVRCFWIVIRRWPSLPPTSPSPSIFYRYRGPDKDQDFSGRIHMEWNRILYEKRIVRVKKSLKKNADQKLFPFRKSSATVRQTNKQADILIISIR